MSARPRQGKRRARQALGRRRVAAALAAAPATAPRSRIWCRRAFRIRVIHTFRPSTNMPAARAGIRPSWPSPAPPSPLVRDHVEQFLQLHNYEVH